MDAHTKVACPFPISESDRIRIRQLLSIATDDASTVESDLFHEFGLSMAEAALRTADTQADGHLIAETDAMPALAKATRAFAGPCR